MSSTVPLPHRCLAVSELGGTGLSVADFLLSVPATASPAPGTTGRWCRSGTQRSHEVEGRNPRI